MSIRAILVTIIGVLLFCAIDFVFGIAIIEFNVVNSSKPEILLPAGKNFWGMESNSRLAFLRVEW
jgi:hypothetical protein